jgi:hypothetical protein
MKRGSRKKRVKPQSDADRRNWARKGYVPEGGWPIDRVKPPVFDVFQYVDHPPSSTLQHTVHKVRMIPKSIKERERLLHDSNSWVAIPIKVEETVPKTFTIKSPYLAPVINFNDDQSMRRIHKSSQISRDDYLLSLGWNPYTDVLPSDELSSHFENTVSTYYHDMDETIQTNLGVDLSKSHDTINDESQGFYESHGWDIRHHLYRGAYKPLSQSQRVVSPQHHHPLTTTYNIKDLLFQSVSIFSVTNKITLTITNNTGANETAIPFINKTMFQHAVKPPMKFSLTASRPRPYVPPFLRKNASTIKSRRHIYQGVAGTKKDRIRWRLTAWGRVMIRKVDTAAAKPKMKSRSIRQRRRGSPSRRLRPASKKSRYSTTYTWLPQPMVAAGIEAAATDPLSTESIPQPSFLTDLENAQLHEPLIEDTQLTPLTKTRSRPSSAKKSRRFSASTMTSQRIIPLP